MLFADDRGLCYVCTLMEGMLHLKAKSANILKAYCTLTEGALHPRSKRMTRCRSVIKLININLIIFPQDLVKHYLKVVLGET